MHIKRICQFIVDSEPDRQDGRLRYRVKWNNNRDIVAFNLGYRVEKDKWSRETQRCKANTTHGKHKDPASLINREIQRYEEAIDEVFSQFEREGINPTKEEFRDAARRALNRAPEIPRGVCIGQYIDQFTAECGKINGWTRNTLKKFDTLKNHLQAFNPKLNFRSFNEAGLAAFVDYLRDGCQLRNTSITKNLSLLKWFLRWALKKGYLHDQSFLVFRPHLKTAKKSIVFLDWDELMRVYSYPIPTEKQYLARVRDVFCFCCFTSLRYSDVANLKRDNVTAECLHITSVKTADTLTIELNTYSRAILDRYREEDCGGNRALPVISNQKMNNYLKELMQMCGIDTPISVTYYRGSERIDETRPKWALIGTHTARRTFICNALALGIAPTTVMKWTGHESYDSMKPYIEVSDKTKRAAMRLFDEK